MEQQDLLTPEDISSEFGIPEPTQKQWRYLNVHGWKDITVKINRRIRHRRSDVEAWFKLYQGVDFLTPNEIAREYGISTSKQQQWRQLNRNGWRDITVRFGGRVRYRRADVEAWVKTHKGV